MSWLKDRWEEVTAQVKMGDNQTASTVRAARAKAAPATTRVNTNQPGWSVRKPQQSLTTQQRIDQSYGGGFSGIKNRVIDTFDANTEADRIKRFARTGLNENYEQQDAGLRKQRIESELKASEAKRDAGGYSNYAPTKAANTVMSGAIRSIHGIGQEMGGLVDLVTPGKGTNRLTDFTKDYGEVWDKKREHAGVNKTAYQLAQLPMTLYGYSVGDKAITGTAQLAAKGISAIPKVGAIVPKVAGAVDTISKSKPMVSAATKLDDIALNGTRAQRVGAKLAQSYAKPGTMGNITALNTLQNAGERSSRGQDNNWGTFATDIATGLAMQGGLNLAGQAGAGVVRGVSNRIIEPTTNLVQRGKSELATGLNTINRGANQHTPYTQLVPTESGRQIVSPRDSGRVIRENFDEISEKTRARIQAAREKVPERFKLNKYGGSNADFDSPTIRNDLTGETIPNPAYRGKNVDPLESLKQEARKYKSAEEFADSLNAMKYGKVTGVGELPIEKINKTQIKALTERGLPHTDTNMKVSDFKPGRKVTQPLEVYSKGGSWVVENGNHRLAQALANGDKTIPVVFKGGEGKKYSTAITDLYNQATQSQPPKSTPVQKVDPLESLKQEARKYKSAEEFIYEKGLEHPEFKRRVAENQKYIDEVLKPARAEANSASRAMQAMEKKYVGKKNLKLTDAEKVKIEAEYKELGDKVRKAQKLEDNLPYNHAGEGIEKDLTDLYNQALKESQPVGKKTWKQINDEQMTERALQQEYERAKNATTLTETELQSVKSLSDEYITKLNNSKSLDEAIRLNQEYMDATNKFEDGTRQYSDAFNDMAGAVDDAYMAARKAHRRATQSPKSTPKAVEAKPPTPFEQNLQTAGLAPQPTKGAIPERVQKVADTKLRSGTQEMPNQQTAKSQAALKQPSAADRRSLKISDQANQTQRSSQPQSQSPVSKLIEGSFDDNSTTKQIKVKGKISDADYRARYGKDRAPEKVKIKPFKTEDYAFEAWKDKGALGLNRETLERNLDRVAGSDAPKVKKFLVDASRNNESNRADFLKDVRGRIRKDVVEGLGIRAKSKESDLVQKYGEGIINDKQLADMAGNKADSVKKAADYFRKEYDSLLDQWNKQRRIHGLDEVPKRSDYFRHFQEISDGISQVGVILNRSELPTSIAGITDIFKPNKPFSNAELRRMGNKTTFDAVSGMDDYLDSVSRQIFHTDTVQRGRSIENAIRKQADENNKIELPNFVANLGEWTNIVSGKKTRVDRAAEALVGRKIYGFTNWARKRTGANMVGANLSSAMSNFIPFTQSLSTTDKRAAVKGLMTSLSSALKGNKNAIDGVKSSFLNRRFMDEAIDARGIRKASEIASTPFRLVDEFTSRAIVAGKYFEGKAKGLLPVDAMKQADDYAAKTLADRSIGQTPNLFNSQTMGLFTQFQLEVNNQLSFLARDIPEFANGNKAKIASSLTQFAVFSYLFNTAYEEVTGRRPQIDPIQAVLDIKGDSDEDSTPYERLGKASERITTGIPGAGIVTDGGRLPINSMMPDFSALGKAASNVAKGDGAVLGQVYKGVSGPLFYGLPPFGGGQLRKTVEGAYAALQGESKTPAGKKRFDIQQDPLNVAKAATFGQYATQEGKEYISKLSDSKFGIKKSGSSSISSDVDSVLKAQFSTKEQRAWLATSATDKKEAAKQDPEKKKWLDQYEATKRVNKNAPERPEGLSKESETILNWHNKRTPQQREKLAYTQNDYDYKLATAQFEEAKLNGTVSRAEMINKQQALAKAKVGKDFTKDTRESYNSLSKAELTTLAENDPNGKQIMADAIAYGDALVKAGLIKKNKLRTGSGSGGRRGGRGGKGRASKFDYTKNLFDSGSDSASTSKQLRAILQKAMSGKS